MNNYKLVLINYEDTTEKKYIQEKNAKNTIAKEIFEFIELNKYINSHIQYINPDVIENCIYEAFSRIDNEVEVKFPYDTKVSNEFVVTIELEDTFKLDGETNCNYTITIKNKNKKYAIRNKETGTVLDDCNTIEFAKQQIAKWEQEDKKEGDYTKDYEIYDKKINEIVE